MKNVSLPTLILLISFMLIKSGCAQQEKDFGEDLPLTKSIALEMYLHYIALEQTNYLNRQQHHEFLSPDVERRLQQHSFYAAQLYRSITEPSDTVFSYEEIPSVRETKTHTIIYEDGTSEAFFEDLTPHDQSLLFHLSESPQPAESRIVATRLSNGWLTAYGPDQKVLFEQPYITDNQREFLDTLEKYVRMSIPPYSSAPPQNPNPLLRLKMNLPEGATASLLPGGNIRMEMSFPSVALKSTSFHTGVLKSSTELNPEMTRTLKFELYQGEFLLQRKIYSYEETPLLRNRYKEMELTENPMVISSQTLTVNSHGMPVLRQTHEYYYRNQSFYYFN